MFSGVAIGFLVAISAAVWSYNKTMQRTGNNTNQSITIGAVAGVISFFVILTLVVLVDRYLASQ